MLLALAGLALSVAIVILIGWDDIVAGFFKIHWRGFLALCVACAIPIGFLSAAWLVLFPNARLKDWPTLYFARLVRDASGELMPFSSLGGFVFSARAAILGGVDPTLAISTTLVDVTAEFIGQLGFSALGIALLFYRANAPPEDLLLPSVAALGAGVLAAIGFIFLQHRASGPIERMVARLAPSRLAQEGAVTTSLHALYQAPLRLTFSSVLHFAAWVLGAVGIWASLWIAGQHYSLRSIVGLESLVYVLRTVFFFVPMGLGVIEGGYAAVCYLFGVPPAFAVALSLMKRARDAAVGLPALILWFRLEGRRLTHGDPDKVIEDTAELVERDAEKP